jgi:hypothetical protein
MPKNNCNAHQFILQNSGINMYIIPSRHQLFHAGSGIGVSNISIYNSIQNITKRNNVVTLIG